MIPEENYKGLILQSDAFFNIRIGYVKYFDCEIHSHHWEKATDDEIQSHPTTQKLLALL